MPEFQGFCNRHGGLWLDDFALFAALKQRFDAAAWHQWPQRLVRRDPEALDEMRQELADEIATVKFVQWQFFDQWDSLRGYASEKGVKFLGDLPIFVAMDSAEVWANRHLFQIDESGRAEAVAGVPPDYFSETGQKWGNPLYDWETNAAEGYRWWIDRVLHVKGTVDLMRVDHFRGFQAYWRVPADAPTAEEGRWVEGPGDELFDAIRSELGQVPFVAEDLGTITEEVHRLRDRQGLAGMKVMQFGFDGNPDHPFLPHTYPERCVAYTGTHDNDTTRGWFDSLDEEEKHRVRTYLSASNDEVVRAMIQRLWESDAALVVVPVQDLFELGSEHRMNTPGQAEGNWQWRMTTEELEDDEVVRWLGELTSRCERKL